MLIVPLVWAEDKDDPRIKIRAAVAVFIRALSSMPWRSLWFKGVKLSAELWWLLRIVRHTFAHYGAHRPSEILADAVEHV